MTQRMRAVAENELRRWFGESEDSFTGRILPSNYEAVCAAADRGGGSGVGAASAMHERQIRHADESGERRRIGRGVARLGEEAHAVLRHAYGMPRILREGRAKQDEAREAERKPIEAAAYLTRMVRAGARQVQRAEVTAEMRRRHAALEGEEQDAMVGAATDALVARRPVTGEHALRYILSLSRRDLGKLREQTRLLIEGAVDSYIAVREAPKWRW